MFNVGEGNKSSEEWLDGWMGMNVLQPEQLPTLKLHVQISSQTILTN
jgi:hypothetical protein